MPLEVFSSSTILINEETRVVFHASRVLVMILNLKSADNFMKCNSEKSLSQGSQFCFKLDTKVSLVPAETPSIFLSKERLSRSSVNKLISTYLVRVEFFFFTFTHKFECSKSWNFTEKFHIRSRKYFKNLTRFFLQVFLQLKNFQSLNFLLSKLNRL